MALHSNIVYVQHEVRHDKTPPLFRLNNIILLRAPSRESRHFVAHCCEHTSHLFLLLEKFSPNNTGLLLFEKVSRKLLLWLT